MVAIGNPAVVTKAVKELTPIEDRISDQTDRAGSSASEGRA
jgi:hypothetical protein